MRGKLDEGGVYATSENDTCPSHVNHTHPPARSEKERANKHTWQLHHLSPSEAKQWLHPLHRKAASQKQKTKEKPVRVRKKKHWKKLPVYKKNSHHHSNSG